MQRYRFSPLLMGVVRKITSKSVIALVVLLVIFLFPQFVLAQVDFGINYGTAIGLGTRDIRETIARIIKIVLGILGIIVTLIIIYGGWMWMTAGGNVQRVDTAKKILMNGVIGLLIIVLAYAITVWIFNIILQGTQGSDGGGGCTTGETSADGCYSCVPPGVWSWNGSCTLPGSEFRIKDVQTSHGGSDPKQDVYLCSRIQSVFNNAVDPVSVENASSTGQLYVRDRDRDQIFIGYWQTAGNSIVFKHDDWFDPNTNYSVYFPREGNSSPLQDLSSLALTSCDVGVGCVVDSTYLVWDFQTGTDNDTVSPYITDTYPTSSTTDPMYPDRNVSRSPIFRVQFSEPIDATTVITGTSTPIAGNIILQEISGENGSVVATIPNTDLEAYVYENGFNFSLIPPNLLKSFTWYRITIANIEDLCGNPMDGPVSWEFQTNDRVPGVVSYYPTGDNVCPDTRVTITFATSMYNQQVAIAITDENGNLVGSASMNPSLLPPPVPPYQVNGTGGVWRVVDDNDISTSFRTFEFAPYSDFDTNTTFSVDITTDLVIDTDGNTLSQQWSFHVSTPESCACAPYITTLSPSEGQAGQCITVWGYCFLGTEANYAAPTVEIGGLPAPVHASSTDYITTTVPNSLSLGEAMTVVTITYDDPNLGTLSSNAVPFNINQSGIYDGPCLYAVSPTQGCGYTNSASGTPVSLTGVRLGDDPTPPTSNYSTDSDNVTFTAGAGTVRADPGEFTLWTPEEIRTGVPTGATDGEVFVTTSGRQSNALPFDVACGVGQPCSNDVLACVPDNNNCAEGLECSTASCLCEFASSTSISTYEFRVNEYWPSCGSACINSEVGARFSGQLDVSTVNDSSIDILPCYDSGCTIFGTEPSFAISFNADQTEFYTYPPLTAATSYRVILYDTITDATGTPIVNLNYDSDGDAINDSFSWTFSTGNTTCRLTAVETEPETINFTAIDQTSQINARARSEQQCKGNNYIDPWGFDWAWSSTDTAIADITSEDVNKDGFDDPVQTVTARGEGTANVSATDNDSGLSDYSVVDVTLTTGGDNSDSYPPPSVISTNPVDSATNICLNVAIEAVFDQLMDAGTITTSTFIVYPVVSRGTINPIDSYVEVINLREGEGNCINSFNGEGCSVARLYPANLLRSNQLYNAEISSTVESIHGVEMGFSVIWSFTTGDSVCKLDEVEVTPEYHLFLEAGEQYTYLATPYANTNSGKQIVSPMPGVYNWEWNWSDDDPDGVVELPLSSNPNRQVVVANNKNGLAEIIATATITEDNYFDPSTVGDKISGVAEAEVWLCENPWPDPPPMEDSDYGFQMKYCRGNNGEVLLESLSDPSSSIIAPTGDNIEREYLFTYTASTGNAGGGGGIKFYKDSVSTGNYISWFKKWWNKIVRLVNNILGHEAIAQIPEDVIGIRIYSNPDRLSPYTWYQQQSFPKGNPQEFAVDGFPALRDKNSVYIMGPKDGSTIETYIYVISYNDLSSDENIDVFNQLVENFRFYTFTTEEKKKIRRDLKRLADASTLSEAIESYKEATGFYPQLSSGTYIPSITNSRWPSWQATLGNALGRSLAVDPINEFSGSCETLGNFCFTDNDCTQGERCISNCEPDYDPATCWNEVTQQFLCPAGSSIYQYRLYGVDDYRVGIYLEMDRWGSLPPRVETIDNFCNDNTYSSSGFCGDGIIQPSLGEECEIGQQRNACIYFHGNYGWYTPVMEDCSNNCTYSDFAFDPSMCGGYCGDGIVNGPEICDGSAGTIANSTCLDDCSNYVCNPGYALIDGQCQPVWCDPDADRSCDIPGGEGVLNTCDLDTLQWVGPCFVVSCNDGYHIEGNKCVPDSPNVTITDPPDNSTGGSSVTVYYDISEGGVINYLVNGTVVDTTGYNAGSYSYTFQNLSIGPHELMVTLNNDNGTFSDSITYTYAGVADVNIINPPDNTCVTNQVTVEYSINQDGDLKFYVDGDLVGGANGQTSGTHYYTYPPVSNEQHNFSVSFSGIYGGSDNDNRTYQVGDGIYAPSGLISTFSDDFVELEWQDNSDNEDSFIVERKQQQTGVWEEKYRVSANTSPVPSQVIFYDRDIIKEQSYYYRVKAVNQCWSSDYSNVTYVYTDNNTPPPGEGCINQNERCSNSLECCEGLVCMNDSNICKPSSTAQSLLN